MTVESETDKSEIKNWMNVHYDPVTGAIKQMDTSPAEPMVAGHECITFELIGQAFPAGIGIDTHKVDVAAKKIVALSSKELAAAQVPKAHEVAHMVWVELNDSDQYMAPDRPLKNQEDWRAYRKALRDLSKKGLSPLDQVKAFPVRPDGTDPIPHLRARI